MGDLVPLRRWKVVYSLEILVAEDVTDTRRSPAACRGEQGRGSGDGHACHRTTEDGHAGGQTERVDVVSVIVGERRTAR